jgi:hypothetical protein
MLLGKMGIYKQLVILSICLFGKLHGDSSAVSYNFSGGRFGDNVLAYLHAKWLSYHYNLPLLYKPFNYSSELNMHDEELWYSDEAKHFRYEIVLNKKKPKPIENNTVYVCPYFPEIEWELKNEYYFTFSVDWKDKQFREHVRHKISSKKSLDLVCPPHMLNVAIHMREGGGFDDEDHKLKHPLKTPPVTFYIASLHKILEMFPNQPIYCHVFTDAVNPQDWVNKIIAALPANAPIQFAYRAQENNHNSNVLEDFFSLFNFDILIRAESNYSIVPSLIHDYAVVCYPKKYSIEGRVVTITEIIVDSDQEICDECSRKYLQNQGAIL